MTQKPRVIFLAPPCTPWSQMQNINDQNMVEAQRQAAIPLLRFTCEVAQHQSQTGNYFIIENPSTSRIWQTRQFLSIGALPNVQWKNTDLCMFGLKDPISQKFYHKRLSLMFNCHQELIDRLFKLCNPKTCKHEHEKVEGQCPGYGNRTKLSQAYPSAFCRAFSDCMQSLTGSDAHVAEDVVQENLLAELT